MKGPAEGDLTAVLQGFRSAHVWVVGDLMLDEYIDGDVQRISPEAPVPVVAVSRTYSRLGGAANVANCLAALGARVSLCGVVGADPAGDTLLAACREAHIDIRAVGQSGAWSTARKLRVVAQHQQLLRLDWERVEPVGDEAAAALIASLRAGDRPDAIVISDYGKGFATPLTVRALIDLGQGLGVPVLVDPKSRDLAAYRGATVVTPNHREFGAMVGQALPPAESEATVALARDQIAKAGIGALVITLGERGMLVVPDVGEARPIRSAGREVFDVTGAGDTLIATLALALAVGADLVTAAHVANAAAGVVVGKFGTAVVHLVELARALTSRPADKVYGEAALAQQVAFWRHQGRTVVFTNGCFDVIHAGHLSLLRYAASHGDVLVVGMNDDASVRRLKGETRPMVPAPERAALVAALDCVDAVVLFGEDTPLRLIESVQPDVLVKGADYRAEDVVGHEVVEARGGRVVLAPLVANRSTTDLIARMRRD